MSKYEFKKTTRVHFYENAGKIQCDASSTTDDIYIDNVTITGYTPGPEIKVLGNGVEIVDGDVTPANTDNTDFGTVNIGTTIEKTFTIKNLGTTNLTISSITLSNSTDFSITGIPYVTPINYGGNTTFTITYNSLTTGYKTATVTIANNDTSESTYQFDIAASANQNYFDSDGDGVYDNIDIDDDNDGILDTVEEQACKNALISIKANYKYLDESFGSGNRTIINTTYNAVTTYCYEDGTVGTNTGACPSLSNIGLNDGEYTVY